MSKRGKLIEFRAGLFGIQHPNNLGIVLERVTRKKTVFFKVYSLKGIQELKSSHVSKRKFDDTLEIPKSLKSKNLEKELKPRLDHLISKYRKKETKRTSTNEQASTGVTSARMPASDYQLWRWYLKIYTNDSPLTSKQMARKWLGVEPNHEQIKEFDKLLEPSSASGTGYFKVDNTSDKDKWHALDPELYEKIIDDIKALEALRDRMIEVETEENEEGYEESINIPVALYVLRLSDDEENLLTRIKQWMEENILNKRLIGDNLLGNGHIHTIGKFALPLFLRFLAEDWTETRYLLQPASAMAEFLFKTDYWSESQALENIAIRAVAEKPNFSWDVDERIQELALELPHPDDQPEEWTYRKDIRSLLAYTVDPATARDFDQALSYKKNTDGSWTLWVHVADVTHYSTPDSLFDAYAKQRATAVYLPPRGLPMHPPALSTGLCALKENESRFAITVKLEFTPEGERKGFEIYQSVVNVKANLSYDFVDEKLAEKDSYWIGMLELGNILRKQFPGLNVETTEARMTTGSKLLDLEVAESSESTMMNEMFMIAANEAVGEFLRDSELPGLYRCHPIPDQPDVEKFNDQMKALGIDYEVTIPKWIDLASKENEEENDDESGPSSVLEMLKAGGKMEFGRGMLFSSKKKKKESDKDTEKEGEEVKKDEPPLRGLAQLPEEERDKWMKPFKEVLGRVKQVEDDDQRKVMHLTTLGMFGRAFYTRRNMGHFGLGSRCYTHYTAPIRRYSDNIVHRLLKGLLNKTATEESPVYQEDEIDELAAHCTDQSVTAERLERRVVGVGLTLMTRRDEWKGSISALVTRIMPHRCFLILRDVVDGRIRTSDLSKEEIIVDPSESIAFRKLKEDAILKRIIRAEDWAEMLNENEEAVEILLRLGQKMKVKITARDYVEGTVMLKQV